MSGQTLGFKVLRLQQRRTAGDQTNDTTVAQEEDLKSAVVLSTYTTAER